LAIEVHRLSGPGLLGSFYAATLCRELVRAGILVRPEVGMSGDIQGLTSGAWFPG
jgi:PD-(D/E)XK nuclease superfamily